MANNKLAIIGGSGLYDVEEFKDRELLDINTPWGKPSDKILKTNYKSKEVYFLPRHGRGHFINPSNINLPKVVVNSKGELIYILIIAWGLRICQPRNPIKMLNESKDMRLTGGVGLVRI